jgi:hypothetical protein
LKITINFFEAFFGYGVQLDISTSDTRTSFEKLHVSMKIKNENYAIALKKRHTIVWHEKN